MAEPDDVLDLLRFCSGIEGTLDQLDFTGKSAGGGFGLDFLVPNGLGIAHYGCGNYWVDDMPPGSPAWEPIYFLCHDAPVMLLQAVTVRQFMSEVFKMYTPPHTSLVDDVREDRLFNVWRKNPVVVSHATAVAPLEADLNTCAGLDFRRVLRIHRPPQRSNRHGVPLETIWTTD